jgi:nucleoside-diphosphate-sugar epimerase
MEAADFRNGERMRELLEGVTYVVHLASAHLEVSLDPGEYWDINVHSLKPLLELCRSSGVSRFIHISSVGAYGCLGKTTADEATVCHPQSIYGETKLAGEKLVLDYTRQTHFPVVILRPAWVYGRFCPRTLKLYRMIRKKRFVMIGNGNNLRHPVYILDFCRAVELAMERNEPVGGVFIIAGPETITSRQLVEHFAISMGLPTPRLRIPYWAGKAMAFLSEAVFARMHKEPPISRRSLEFFDTDNAFDNTKARRQLGFEPCYPFTDGLQDCRAWLENQSA